ncbi:DUF5331 domain-containing protein [Dolichospermum circinale]|uniref:DUF5331 domain-containing protein n=1 Tax=Dolichospermum circinale TaxID=109265 RepID=UPI00232D5F7B|nr:DUF5331 domain-containing protein [Dolichospermum circinale]MDB9455808.1 DUF5331 domain-containing protein [Dolichospermum circinale CS-541/06]MDB9463091.1 DUF5331 domain-containing protein [Dolichospermum circinale CS-541/04]MDB9546016.1 DUF5331 domain-containing protein [Dolichospermum circinale CS-1031]
MAFFDSFTDSLKQKWLQFFQANREWITLLMTVESVYTPDGGQRPSSYLILGVINTLEPKLAQLMLPFGKLNPDVDSLIEVLGLNFDSDIVLGNRLSPSLEQEIYSRHPAVVMEHISEPEIAQESEAISSGKTMDNFGNVSLPPGSNSTGTSDNREFNAPASVNSNVLNGINLSVDNSFDELSTSAKNRFDDVVSDIWGDKKSLHQGEENNNLLIEELPSEVFNESEMARLFPDN